jgi:anionic cell wall polymer biosynthesis LytR-Cps2A-Psr (LCP) family protein
MAYGARVPGSDQQDVAQGFALLARTVSDYTGIERFDAGAVVSFRGLSRLVDAIGGVDLYVEREVTSIHLRANGRPARVVDGPYMTYPEGWFHFQGWQALDYARQRYDVPDGAYGRERHHRQLVRAIAEKVFSFGLTEFPMTAPFVVSALGDTVTLDLRGRQLHEYVFALRDLRPEAITIVNLPGGSIFSSSSGNYLGEALRPVADDYFEAVRDGTVAEFLDRNPSVVGEEPPPRTPGSPAPSG